MQSISPKRSLIVALLAIAFAVTLVNAESVSDFQKPTDYVTDHAHVLSPEGIAGIDKLCAELDHGPANTQVAVVTVKDLDGQEPADWANELEDKWHMGKKGSDRGVLVLLSMDHHWRIDVGYGLEGVLNDAKVGDIGRAMRPLLKAGNYDQALLEAVQAISEVVTPKEQEGGTTPQPHRPTTADIDHRNGIILGVLLLVIVGIIAIVSVELEDRKRRNQYLANQETDLAHGRVAPIYKETDHSGAFVAGMVADEILSEHENREPEPRRREDDDNDSGSSSIFGGGGDGGSGDSGGGFDGFGGGDFGGGGAGGDW